MIPSHINNEGSSYQKTIKKAISFTGIGLHTGKQSLVTLKPAPIHSGITFIRKDVQGQPEIPALFKYVRSTHHATTIGLDSATQIHTVEHLMAALAGMCIDNIIIEVEGEEIPIMDGSAAPFLFLLECAGIKEQEASRSFIEILEPIEIVQENRKVSLEPYTEGLLLDVQITFQSKPGFSRQTFTYRHLPQHFKTQLAQARTFGFMEEIEYLKKQGLALGGSLKNAIVFQQGSVLNEDGLRFEDECVRHKILDAVGDLYLFGYPLKGHFKGLNSGHSLNYLLLQKLYDTPKAWRIREEKNLLHRFSQDVLISVASSDVPFSVSLS